MQKCRVKKVIFSLGGFASGRWIASHPMVRTWWISCNFCLTFKHVGGIKRWGLVPWTQCLEHNPSVWDEELSMLIFSSLSLGWYNSLHYKLPKALLTAVIKDCYEGGKGSLRMCLYSWSQLRQWHTRYFRQRKLLLSTGKKMSHNVKSRKPTAGIWGR